MLKQSITIILTNFAYDYLLETLEVVVVGRLMAAMLIAVSIEAEAIHLDEIMKTGQLDLLLKHQD